MRRGRAEEGWGRRPSSRPPSIEIGEEAKEDASGHWLCRIWTLEAKLLAAMGSIVSSYPDRNSENVGGRIRP